ncbi:hypothetical protein [Shewanella cutis]|uniref:Anti-sigma factor n=1 Tax=Shewanella cutis TaxID=2766780 RepID=A0ABS9R0R4_9GAMM|nr:hypothetical protein [Shewanella sp. PS-2]MCG9966194.1 hypothetical protein [Shewanella sp. PS-2]
MSNSTLSSEELALRQEVSTWYFKQALEMPPDRLDQDILRLAQTQLSERNVSQLTPSAMPIWRRFPWVLSSAASLVIVVGLVVLNRGQFEEDMGAPAALTMSAPMPARVATDVAEAKVQEAEMTSQARLAEDTAKQTAQREVMRAQANMAAEENIQAKSRSLPQVARAHPEGDVQATVNTDTAALMSSLARLQELIESKKIQEALVLEQTLVKQYPELSQSSSVKAAANDAKAVVKFKALQQQLHPLRN